MNKGDMLNKSKKSNKKEKEKRMSEITSQLRDMSKGKIKSDVTGSYTGMSEDGGYPVQDADDL